MDNIICDSNLCTGCSACVKICEQKAIRMSETDFTGTVHPVVDLGACTNCGKCRLVCQVRNYNAEFRYPIKAYAARSINEKIRSDAASGGIASSIYMYAIENGLFSMATYFDRDEGVVFRAIENLDDIDWARDSKYVYSDMSDAYESYSARLEHGNKGVFIGLPCQVEALRRFLVAKQINMNNIVFVDIICHGVPNFKLLNEHLAYIEKKKKKKIDRVLFRHPNSDYCMNCFSGDRTIWKKGMHENDEYYRGFSIDILYRDNCYSCMYAKGERVSDITLGDYSGLGKMIPFDGDKYQMSLVLCNTAKGSDFFKELCKNKNIEFYERPVEEALTAEGNPQLRGPAQKSKRREIFLNNYEANMGFEKSCRVAMHDLFIDYYIHSPYIYARKMASRLLPARIKLVIKQIIKK